MIMIRTDKNKLEVYFFKTRSGLEPVREWLKELDKKDRLIIGTDIKTVQYGYPIGMPLVKPLIKGLLEVRSNLSKNQVARVIFCVESDKIILLHSFIKKTQKTPQKDLDLAIKRYKELKNE